MRHTLLQLHGRERVRYFAPVGFCAFLGVLCLALATTSMFLRTVDDAIVITVTGVLGVMACALTGWALLHLQLRWLRYAPEPLSISPQAAWEAVHTLAQEAGWRITRSTPGQTLTAHTPGTLFDEGERIAVEFRPHEALIASICDPSVGFSLIGNAKCRQHCARIRRALREA
ncbi:MAG TPA: hypothetical protein VHW25_02260 [Steroidobacteraceae bacterium]|nr:hypothetical protein [Steroidobacteraceae bacterium]